MKSVAAAVLIAASACIAAPATGGRWERFEAAVTNNQTYADP